MATNFVYGAHCAADAAAHRPAMLHVTWSFAMPFDLHYRHGDGDG